VQIYEYKCPECDQRYTSTDRCDRLGQTCRLCEHPGPLHRVFSIAVHRPIHVHYNETVGKTVTGKKDFANKLRQKGEEYTARTGIETNYQPIEPGDIKQHVTEEGLDGTNRERVKRGMAPISL
jgi:hypothetical protein